MNVVYRGEVRVTTAFGLLMCLLALVYACRGFMLLLYAAESLCLGFWSVRGGCTQLIHPLLLKTYTYIHT